MGLRGIGARPKPKPGTTSSVEKKLPWWGIKGRADRVIKFCESLPITSGVLAGQKLRLRPWQKEFIRAVYCVDKDGRRRVRTAVLSMARKNGKTQLAAVLALCHFVGPEKESRGEVYSAANDRFQAARIFHEMVAIIEREPWMSDRINITRFMKQLEDWETGSTFAALSADVATKHGLSPSFCVYDELGQSPGRDLLDALNTAMGARNEPLMLVISTQAATDQAPMSELIDYGLRIERGELEDPSFHLSFYTAPMDADPWSKKTWDKANPALGDFRSLEDVERQALQAQRMPSKAASFRNLILNQRIDATEGIISAELWMTGADPVDLDSLVGRPCYAGLDLGATRDLTALVLAFEDGSGGYDVVPFCFMPEEAVSEREDSDRQPYKMWQRQGHLLTTPGRTSDPEAVAMQLAELHGRFDIQACAYDRWRIEDFRRKLEEIGSDVPMVEYGQGFKDMAPAFDVFERLAVEGKLRHGAHPVLTMCVANAKTEADAAGNRKLNKKRSNGRIDALVALMMALGVATRGAGPVDVNTMVF